MWSTVSHMRTEFPGSHCALPRLSYPRMASRIRSVPGISHTKTWRQFTWYQAGIGSVLCLSVPYLRISWDNPNELGTLIRCSQSPLRSTVARRRRKRPWKSGDSPSPPYFVGISSPNTFCLAAQCFQLTPSRHSSVHRLRRSFSCCVSRGGLIDIGFCFCDHHVHESSRTCATLSTRQKSLMLMRTNSPPCLYSPWKHVW